LPVVQVCLTFNLFATLITLAESIA
jgi:hypothetical protein